MVNHRSKDAGRPRRLSVILSCGFLIGSILGATWAAGLDSVQTEQLRSYISEYLSVAEQTGVAVAFGSVFWNHFRWYLCLFFFGLSACCVLCLPVMLGLRGFLLTFAVGCFLRVFGGTGIVPVLVLFGLPSVLWLPAMWIAVSSMMECCFSQIASKGGAWKPAPGLRHDVAAALGISFLLVLLCVFLEYWILPGLLSVAARIIT